MSDSTIPSNSQQPPPMGDATGGLIPYKNVPALVGYYLGVFSLIPCLGLLLAVPALVLGIIGLVKAAKMPTARGKVHAWVAIILGAVSLLGHAAFSVLPYLMARH